MPRFVNRLPGDRVSTPGLPGANGKVFPMGNLGGTWLVIGFPGRADHPATRAAIHALAGRGDLLDGRRACAIIALPQPRSDPCPALPGLPTLPPGLHLLADPGAAFARSEGAAAIDDTAMRPLWLICDPQMRLVDSLRMTGPDGGAAAVLARLSALPPPDLHAGVPLQAPVLVLPRVFDGDLCRDLIAAYDHAGGRLSGFMLAKGGRTVGRHDPAFKIRRDHLLADRALIARTNERITRRVVPELARLFFFAAARLERYLVACYDGDEGGHFAAHRDNTTPGTAHRRFAVSVNLNDGFDGGGVSFPEYGAHSFVPPPGGAVVFSCALLHAVVPVTAGRRYAFLPFLYDDAGEVIRQRNLHTVEPASTPA